MSDTLVELLMIKTVGVLLLAMIVLAVRPMILKWLNAHVAYRLWLVIPLFILLPVNWFENNVTPQVMTFFPDTDFVMPKLELVSPAMDDQFSNQLLALWLIGFVISLFIYVVRYRKLFNSFTQSGYRMPTEMMDKQLKLNLRKVKVVHTPLVEVPAIFGLMNSFLILPKGFDKQTVERQIMVLSHELYHLARRDHQVNILRTVIKCIFWFNPILYWADKYVEADQEISCDLGVVQSTQEFGAKQYGEALLDAMNIPGNTRLVSQWNYPSLIKARLKMLKNIKQKKWHNWAVAVFAAASLWSATSVIGIEKSEEAEVKPKTVVEPRYPRNAAEEGVEGWVKFQFDLDNEGAPQNIKIVDSTPKGVFEKVANDALAQWKFVLNKGKTKNIYYTMEFRMPLSPGVYRSQDVKDLVTEMADFKAKRRELVETRKESAKKGEIEKVAKIDDYLQKLDLLIEAQKKEFKGISEIY